MSNFNKKLSTEEFSKLSLEEQDEYLEYRREANKELWDEMESELPNEDEYRCAMLVKFEEMYGEKFDEDELSEFDRARGKKILNQYPGTADTIFKLYKLIDKIE